MRGIGMPEGISDTLFTERDVYLEEVDSGGRNEQGDEHGDVASAGFASG